MVCIHMIITGDHNIQYHILQRVNKPLHFACKPREKQTFHFSLSLYINALAQTRTGLLTNVTGKLHGRVHILILKYG